MNFSLSQNKLFYIAGGFVVVVIILVMFIFLGSFGGLEQKGRVRLEFWGVFDRTADFRTSLNAFENLNPDIRISYKQFNFEDYEKELVSAFAAGRGPDVFMVHNTWIPKHQEKMAPLPQKISGQKEPLFTLRDFREQFVEVADYDLVVNEEIYALPLYVDSLALYYNKDIFNSSSIAKPPAVWEEFNEVVEKITKVGENNQITQAGAALGTAKNVNRSTDIVALMMMQSGVPMTDSTGQVDFTKKIDGQSPGEVALQYYTDFANSKKRVYTWNNTSFYSIDAFQQGTAAMMLNYAHQIPVLRERAPRLNFAVAAMPQLNSDRPLNYANYWAAGVSKFSESPVAAWRFLVYLTSLDGVAPYLNSAKHPTARRDLIDQQRDDVELGVFAKQALTARSWYQVDNEAIEGIMADMIENVNFKRKTPQEALETAENQINLLANKR